MGKNRYLYQIIQQDALSDKKMAFISGPRQVGKTTLAKTLLDSPQNYYTWDESEFKIAWSKSPTEAIKNRGPGCVVLDEIHKDLRWKSRLKGLYDIIGRETEIVVTGSARLDLYRRGGDSMMGRYFPYRLHPYTVAESDTAVTPEHVFQTKVPLYSWDDLMVTGGFPEPFWKADKNWAKRWSRLRRERLVMEDVRDLRAIRDLSGMQVFVELFPRQVGSLLSINSLREDSGVAYGTAWEWAKTLEALYFHFLIKPYTKKVSRAIKASPKAYLFDILPISNPAARKENLIALHLYKACQYWTDTAQGDFELTYLRTKDNAEVDFCITKDKEVWMLVECKSNQESLSKTLVSMTERLKPKHSFQLVDNKNTDRYFAALGIRLMGIEGFLAGLL